jgi:hypothetical protein
MDHQCRSIKETVQIFLVESSQLQFSRLRSGSAVIHRLTISGRAERDEGISKNPSSPKSS